LASDPEITTVQVPLFFWRQVIFQLQYRGAGKRESGAFLLGQRHGTIGRVRKHICYDDLDPGAYQSGAIAFHAVGCAALWKFCREENLQVLADVHTHPGTGIWQSPTDQQNPMLPVVGHTAIILPNFGLTPWWSLKAAGVYEYLGNLKWRTYGVSEKSRRVSLTLW
jgi:proteasome lid subunit RPN8/RPN11